MAQHISIRVPWHDNGWNGCVCLDPERNNSCLCLKGICEHKNDAFEAKICGRSMRGYERYIPCVSEGAAFMCERDLSATVIHPYKQRNMYTYGHFRKTEVVYPAYSFPTKPFAWMRRDVIKERAEIYNIDYHAELEQNVGSYTPHWVMEADNQRAIFDFFYKNVIPDESLCIAYAKQVPFAESGRRVVVAVGNVRRVIPAVEYKYDPDTKNTARSMVWETMVCHSIREDHTDGFVIPYREMMEYAQTHPEFDIESITVFAPDDAFSEFSYATEHVSHDTAIDVIVSCIKAFKIINKCLDEDYSNVLKWLYDRLYQLWEDRGPYPGLGEMLCALGVPMGIPIAREIKERIKGTDTDLWDYVDKCFADPQRYLSKPLADKISVLLKNYWNGLGITDKPLFKLLSRFSLSLEQAATLFESDKRKKIGIKCGAHDILENPYILYEEARLNSGGLFVSIGKVDKAIFPVKAIRERYPLEEPSALTSVNDERRIRAIAVSVLEAEALKGNTILPCNLLVERMCGQNFCPSCRVTEETLAESEDFLSKEIIKRETADGKAYYKLSRLNRFDEVIEKCVGKRLKAEKLKVDTDWRKLLDDKFDDGNQGQITPDEERARCEKAAILNELATSRISVLVGNAGTGKTTVLSVLCSEPTINDGGVLLLAPTGKATIRLNESMEDSGGSFASRNVAQFLRRGGRFDWNEKRYKLTGMESTIRVKTVIIDEASMLTEEMFGALLEALDAADRIIFVGDPNQLPPIGAGRPFVDLVFLLREKLTNTFPRVCDSYGELTVNRRQLSETMRLDVQLADMYTATDEFIDEDIFSEIENNENGNIRFVKWKDRDDLEQKLLQIIADETCMLSVDDTDGFNSSIGGDIVSFGEPFKLGCANYADKWQILAPVRNMPHGVMNINRLLHLKYLRKCSERNGSTAKSLGSEGIVYGDKVINTANRNRSSVEPSDGASGYVANGEIGIVCKCSGDNRSTSLGVEFSSQKGYTYYYTEKDFNEESGANNLELAYALTVHKSQGSQFGTVILVLAEPCRLLSREMLYTALTRQTKKIVIMYNRDGEELLKYTSDEKSDIAKRFTDLFAGTFSGGARKPRLAEINGTLYDSKMIKDK